MREITSAVVYILALLTILGCLSLFAGGPTGEYHVDVRASVRAPHTPGLVVYVYQDMKFRPDRCIFVGTPAAAHQVLKFYQEGPQPAVQGRTTELILETADLIWQLNG